MAAAASPGTAGAALELRLKQGDSRVYAVRYQGTAEADLGALAAKLADGMGSKSAAKAERSRIAYDYSAELHWRVVSAEPSGWLVAARLQNAEYRVDGVADERRELLEKPFLVSLNRTGAVRELRFPNHYPTALAQAVRAFVDPLQAVLAGGAQWTASERGADGTWDARYEVRSMDPKAGTAQVVRTKTAFRPDARTTALRTRVDRSEATIEVALDGSGVVRVEASEATTQFSGSTFLTSHRGTYTATRTGAPAAGLPADATRALLLLNDPSVARAASYEVGADIRATVEAIDSNRIVPAFVNTLGSNTGAGHRLLTSWVRRFPERSADLARRLDTYQGPNDEAVVGFGFSALSAAGHVEAQHALADALGPGFSARTHTQALYAVVDVESPETFLLDAVWSYRSSLRVTDAGIAVELSLATNAYGALGDARKGNPEVTARVLSTLSVAMRSATDVRARKLVLDALSNVGDFGAVAPMVAPFFSSRDELLREAAFETFRRMDGDRAFAAFAARYAAETSARVREAAARTALEMSDSPARNAWAVREAAATTKPETLSVLVQIMGRGLAAHPENEAALRDVLKTNHDRKVRRDVYAFVAPKAEGGAR